MLGIVIGGDVGRIWGYVTIAIFFDSHHAFFGLWLDLLIRCRMPKYRLSADLWSANLWRGL